VINGDSLDVPGENPFLFLILKGKNDILLIPEHGWDKSILFLSAPEFF